MRQQQQKKRLPTIPAFRKQQQASSGSDGSQSVGGQRESKNNHGSSRRRAWCTVSNTQKLRQREEREIRELEARIEVEMPLPGLSWVPLLSADVAKLRVAAQHLPNPSEVNQAATTSHGLRGYGAESSPKGGLEKGENLTTTRLATAAGTLPASPGEDRLTAGGAVRAGLTEARQGVSTATAGESGRDLAVARAAATAAEEGGNAPTLSRYFFTDLPLSNHTQRGLRDGGFVLMSQIQLRVIPHALRGADVMGEAKTGSGKTLAFLVPVLECLYRNRVCSIDGVSALILAPTRELAVQIFNVVKVVSRYHEFSAGCLIGGKDVAEEAERVHTLNIVVGTPGRVLQHTEESQLWDATNLKILVIDEADRLADMGFIQTTRFIIEQLPADRQTLFFSATLRTAVKRLASFAARPDAEYISVGGGGGLGDSGVAAAGQENNSISSSSSDTSCNPATPLTLTQSYMIVPPQFKLSALFSFLRTHSNRKTLVFVSSCKQARFVAEIFKLLKPGPKLFFLHGRQKQARRIEVFHAFIQRSPACCLISTDLASRGIDFAQLSVGMPAAFDRSSSTGKSSSRGRHTDPRQQGLKGRALTGKAEHGGGDPRSAKGAAPGAVDFVVQLDCPDSVETYIHRVGRTARMQRSGHALLLLLPSERAFVSRLKARKIEPKETFINPQRAVKIENKLQALLASNLELKQLAQQALGCYLRCIALMPDKQVFSLPSDRQTLTLFAKAYGLQLPPKITFLSSNSSIDSSASSRSPLDKTVDGEEDIRTCGGALGASALKKKNSSKLERLREKIRQRRKEKQEHARMESSGGTAPGEALSHAATPSTTVEPVSVAAAASKPKKISSSEAAVAPDEAAAVAEASTSGGESDSRSGGSTAKRACCGSKLKLGLQKEEEQDDSDQQFFFVRKQKPDEQDDDAEDTQRLLQEWLMQKPGFKRERLRFRADGSAKVRGLAAAELSRQHVFFNEEEEEDEDEHEQQRDHRDLAASAKGEAKQSNTELMSADISAIEVTTKSKESALIEKGRSGECSGSRRDAFLATMRTRLSLQEPADKERDRQRIHERHTQRRVKERLRRQAEAAGLKGQGVGGQAALVPTAVLGSVSDVGESGYEQDTDEDKEEGERALNAENEMRRKARRTCRSDRGGLAPEAPATERVADSTGDDGFQDKKSQQLKSVMTEPRGGSTKKRCLEMAERRGKSVVKKSRQRRQEDVQRQQVHAEEASDISLAAETGEHERTSARNPVDIAEDEAARLERVALQLLQNGVTNRSGLV